MQENVKKSMEFQIKTQKVEVPESQQDKILINLNKCEKLFQEDKSEKFLFFNLKMTNFFRQKLEIEQLKKSIEERQTLENDFYYSLNLDEFSKKKIFNFSSKEKPHEKKFVLIQDPIKGNIIQREI